MKKESLDKASEEIIKALKESDIDDMDKLELMLNLYHMLDNYEENIKVLKKLPL